MSSSPVRHPDDRLLIAFQLSKLDQRQIALVNKHLKECRECRHRLQRLAAEMEIPIARKRDAGDAPPGTSTAPQPALADCRRCDCSRRRGDGVGAGSVLWAVKF